jgi:hypothetical protein
MCPAIVLAEILFSVQSLLWESLIEIYGENLNTFYKSERSIKFALALSIKIRRFTLLTAQNCLGAAVARKVGFLPLLEHSLTNRRCGGLRKNADWCRSFGRSGTGISPVPTHFGGLDSEYDLIEWRNPDPTGVSA